MTDTDAARILAELAARYRVEPFDPSQDVTLADVIASLQCSEAAARRYVRLEVAAGRLTLRKLSIHGAPTNIYRKQP